MTNFLKKMKTNSDIGYKEKGTLTHSWVNSMQSWKSVWDFFKKLETDLT